jgi:hypothetical protein
VYLLFDLTRFVFQSLQSTAGFLDRMPGVFLTPCQRRFQPAHFFYEHSPAVTLFLQQMPKLFALATVRLWITTPEYNGQQDYCGKDKRYCD